MSKLGHNKSILFNSYYRPFILRIIIELPMQIFNDLLILGTYVHKCYLLNRWIKTCMKTDHLSTEYHQYHIY